MEDSDRTYEYWLSVYDTLKNDVKRINKQIMIRKTRLAEIKNQIGKIDQRFENMTGTGRTVGKYKQINVELRELRHQIRDIMKEVSELKKDRKKVRDEMKAIRENNI